MTTQTKDKSSSELKNFSTMTVHKDGTPEVDQVGLSKVEAYNRRRSQRKAGVECFVLDPPPEDRRFEDDNFGLVFVNHDSACLYAIGISEAFGNQLADEGLAKGNDIIRAAYVFEMQPIMWNLGVACSIFF